MAFALGILPCNSSICRIFRVCYRCMCFFWPLQFCRHKVALVLWSSVCSDGLNVADIQPLRQHPSKKCSFPTFFPLWDDDPNFLSPFHDFSRTGSNFSWVHGMSAFLDDRHEAWFAGVGLENFYLTSQKMSTLQETNLR